MIILCKGMHRVFIPDGETHQVGTWEAQGFQREDVTPPAPAVDWTQVKGVSAEIANALLYVGLISKAALLAFVETSPDALTQIPGIGPKRAQDIVAWAKGA